MNKISRLDRDDKEYEWLKIVFVEGRDDKHVVSRIISKSDLAELDICVIEKEGINNLLDALSADAKRPVCSTVGFVLDANDRPEGRWNSVVNLFMNEGIKFPNSTCPDGTIVEGSSEKRLPRIGAWLMPYNDLEQGGELEDFVVEMVPNGDPILPVVQKYFDSINIDDQPFSPRKRSKAVIHAWLATRSQPGQMGSAIQRNELQVNGELCRKFVNWIRRLFSEN